MDTRASKHTKKPIHRVAERIGRAGAAAKQDFARLGCLEAPLTRKRALFCVAQKTKGKRENALKEVLSPGGVARQLTAVLRLAHALGGA